MDWQTIESAPKDGTAFLAYLPGREGYVARQDVAIIHWTGWGGGAWEDSTGYKIAANPTHWMPLPDPPHPLIPLHGRFRDDPTWDEYQRNIEENRGTVEASDE